MVVAQFFGHMFCRFSLQKRNLQTKFSMHSVTKTFVSRHSRSPWNMCVSVLLRGTWHSSVDPAVYTATDCISWGWTVNIFCGWHSCADPSANMTMMMMMEQLFSNTMPYTSTTLPKKRGDRESATSDGSCASFVPQTKISSFNHTCVHRRRSHRFECHHNYTRISKTHQVMLSYRWWLRVCH